MGASVGVRTVDMYRGRFGEGGVEGDVDWSSEVSSSLLSFSIAGEPSSTAASLLLPSVRPVKEIHPARRVFHASTRIRTMNVRCRMDSRRATTGGVSTDADAPDAGDVGCGRCNDASAMKSAGDERDRLGRAFETGVDGRRNDFVDQVCTRGREESEPVARRERARLSPVKAMNDSCSLVGVDGGVLAAASASNCRER